MQQEKISPFIKWWVTPKLPLEDVFASHNFFSQWLAHPIKRRLAHWYLKLLQKYTKIKVIGITGSAGKTTTKEMLASILKLDGKTVYTPKNIDSIYSIPNTILSTPPGTKYLILEMGVEHLGELDFYLWLAKPDVGVITNISATHTEFFGDIGGVFREKSKLVLNLLNDDTAVLNYQDEQLRKLKGKLRSKETWFGNGTEVMSSLEKYTKDFKTRFDLIFDQNQKNRTTVTIPILGRQFVIDALAASAAAYALKVSTKVIKEGLEKYNIPPHRMQIIKHVSGALILDDTYNNNPQAAKESISTFFSVSDNKDKIIIFGDMLELGNLEQKYHREIGDYLAKFPMVSKLICVGSASKSTGEVASRFLGHTRVFFAPSWREALREVKPLLKDNTTVLVKGSRSIHLDMLINSLT